MITTDRLADIAKRVWEYGEEEAVEITEPVGVQPLPQEWKEKIAPYQFNKAKAYIVESVNLCGPGLVGIWHNDVVLDTAYFGRIDLWERNKPYFHWARQAMDMPVRRVPYATSFVNVWSHNYFHWVLDLIVGSVYGLTTGLAADRLYAGRGPDPCASTVADDRD